MRGSEIGRAQEVSVAMHPTFTHAAADLRRRDYLAEAAAQWHERPEQERLRVRRRGGRVWQLLANLADTVNWLVREFETTPATRPTPPPARRLSGSTLR